MIKFILIALAFNYTSLANADQTTTTTCTGKNVILTTKSPYLGENSRNSQTLFILKDTDNENETKNTAYFLNVSIEGDVDANQMVWTVGKNPQGGKFTLKTRFWQSVGDGTIINEETYGVLTYNHGPLKGTDVAVKCVRN